MAAAPWVVSDESWELVEPLLPKRERRFRYAGRRRLPDRQALEGVLFVLHTGIAWRHLPLELGFGSGSTCLRRLEEWQQAGVWERLHRLLLAKLRAADGLEWARAVADSSQVQAKKGAPKRMSELLQLGVALALRNGGALRRANRAVVEAGVVASHTIRNTL